MLLMFGGFALIELVGAVDIPPVTYVIAALVITGLGLIVSAWWGRARALIALGVVLTLALPVAHASQSLERPEHFGAHVSWTPESVSEIAGEYRVDFGEGTLDLRGVDFTGRSVPIRLHTRFGNIQVLLPPDVAVESRSRVSLGNSTALERSAGGIRTSRATSSPGQPGAGTVQLDIRVFVGNVEVSR